MVHRNSTNLDNFKYILPHPSDYNDINGRAIKNETLMLEYEFEILAAGLKANS